MPIYTFPLPQVPAVQPQQTVKLDLSQIGSMNDLQQFLAENKGKEVTADIEFRLIHDEPLLKAGHVSARQQFVLQPRHFTTLQEYQDISNVEFVKAVTVDSTLACYTLKAVTGLAVTVNRRTGRLDYVDVHGKPLLEDGFSVTPNFWRAPTDNDYGAQLQRRFAVWKNPEMHLKAVKVLKSRRDAAITVLYDMPQVKATLEITYMLRYFGQLCVTQTLHADPQAKDIPDLFRFGQQWVLPGDLSQITYYGRGPIENYIDRNNGQLLGVYHQAVADQYWGYVRPQESGNKTDVRYWTLTDKQGRGLSFVALEAPMECSALNYLPSDLDDGPEKAATQHHSGDLIPRPFTVLQVQARQFGVGGINSWGTWPRKEYRMPYQDYRFSFIVKPVKL